MPKDAYGIRSAVLRGTMSDIDGIRIPVVPPLMSYKGL